MEKSDQEIKADYDRLNGNSIDVGTIMLKKREIARRLKLKSGRTAKVWKFTKPQTYAVFIKTS